MLSVDPTTSRATRGMVEEALVQLWPLALDLVVGASMIDLSQRQISASRLGNESVELIRQTAVGLAISICEHASSFPPHTRSDLLMAIGNRTEQCQEIVRFVGTDLLIPGCLALLPYVSLAHPFFH